MILHKIPFCTTWFLFLAPLIITCRAFVVKDGDDSAKDVTELSNDDICATIFCGKGKECAVTPSGTPKCICRQNCPNHVRPICGSDGRTYDNHCQMHRAACVMGIKLKKESDGECPDDEYYYDNGEITDQDELEPSIFDKDEEIDIMEDVDSDDDPDDDRPDPEDEQDVPTVKEVKPKVTEPKSDHEEPIPQFQKPLVCYEIERDNLRQMLIDWMKSKVEQEGWFTKGKSYSEVLSENFEDCDLDMDGYLDSREFLECTERNQTKEVFTDDGEGEMIRGLCVDALIVMADKDQDWTLDLEEFKDCFDPDTEPPKKKCSLMGKDYEDGSESSVGCNLCICACGNWVCTPYECTEENIEAYKTYDVDSAPLPSKEERDSLLHTFLHKEFPGVDLPDELAGAYEEEDLPTHWPKGDVEHEVKDGVSNDKGHSKDRGGKKTGQPGRHHHSHHDREKFLQVLQERHEALQEQEREQLGDFTGPLDETKEQSEMAKATPQPPEDYDGGWPYEYEYDDYNFEPIVDEPVFTPVEIKTFGGFMEVSPDELEHHGHKEGHGNHDESESVHIAVKVDHHGKPEEKVIVDVEPENKDDVIIELDEDNHELEIDLNDGENPTEESVSKIVKIDLPTQKVQVDISVPADESPKTTKFSERESPRRKKNRRKPKRKNKNKGKKNRREQLEESFAEDDGTEHTGNRGRRQREIAQDGFSMQNDEPVRQQESRNWRNQVQ